MLRLKKPPLSISYSDTSDITVQITTKVSSQLKLNALDRAFFQKLLDDFLPFSRWSREVKFLLLGIFGFDWDDIAVSSVFPVAVEPLQNFDSLLVGGKDIWRGFAGEVGTRYPMENQDASDGEPPAESRVKTNAEHLFLRLPSFVLDVALLVVVGSSSDMCRRLHEDLGAARPRRHLEVVQRLDGGQRNLVVLEGCARSGNHFLEFVLDAGVDWVPSLGGAGGLAGDERQECILEHVGDADDDEGEGVGVQGVEAEGGRHLRVVPLEEEGVRLEAMRRQEGIEE